VTIDGEDVGTTPMSSPIELGQGKHTIRFVHDWYAPIERPVEIPAGTSSTARPVTLDFCKEGTLHPGKSIPAGSCGGVKR